MRGMIEVAAPSPATPAGNPFIMPTESSVLPRRPATLVSAIADNGMMGGLGDTDDCRTLGLDVNRVRRVEAGIAFVEEAFLAAQRQAHGRSAPVLARDLAGDLVHRA